ncbi:MAG: YkvA family protein [Desulfobacterales bacterium]|nr:YkvA family protein [Desulfobacterales bacterium]
MDVKKVLSGINEDFIKKGAASVNAEDVKKVMDKAEDITEKVIKSGPLQRFIKDVALLISMVKDHWAGVYRRLPWWVIAAVVFALLYILSPIDLIPDFIPFIGLLDDALVMGLCLALIEQDLLKYQEWKEAQRSL